MYIDLKLNDIHPLLNQIEEQFHFDLREYSTATLLRRIHRILLLFQLRSIEEFSELLVNDPSMFPLLLNELTVNTTEMFRDTGCWKSIQSELIPRLASNNKPLRIWHNACSSGEEAYSFLILAIEAGIFDQVEIFATDINTNCLKIAESGIYEKKYIEKYNVSYVKSGGKKSLFDYGQNLGDFYFQFHDSLSSKIKFSYLDIIKDPGIPDCDLIFSRNVLIYFMMALQDRMVSKLFKCMKTNAYLCLGNNENLTWTNDFKQTTFPFQHHFVCQN